MCCYLGGLLPTHTHTKTEKKKLVPQFEVVKTTQHNTTSQPKRRKPYDDDDTYLDIPYNRVWDKTE